MTRANEFTDCQHTGDAEEDRAPCQRCFDERLAAVREERRRIYGRAQGILAVDLPYIPLWWWRNVVVVKPTVRGFVPYPDGNLISFKNVSFAPPEPPT